MWQPDLKWSSKDKLDPYDQMTGFINQLNGKHVTQRVRVRTNTNRVALRHLWEILSREFLDSYEEGLFWPEEIDAEKIEIFGAKKRKSMTSMFKTTSVLRGLSILEERRQILTNEKLSKNCSPETGSTYTRLTNGGRSFLCPTEEELKAIVEAHPWVRYVSP